ncbi:hypothetical protein Pyn_25025 [Prunus yedoensis var. nudiflora]|uniref:Uncharacterized protein n=1 Tax=Prunus yedoensis var. nudiflora TaxID=2094558 RepID=A0A315ADJ0_PRUYE|nr:hypothetical protein Pyn_25025 [Prunus yedoensis var. nudiflora]
MVQKVQSYGTMTLATIKGYEYGSKATNKDGCEESGKQRNLLWPMFTSPSPHSWNDEDESDL